MIDRSAGGCYGFAVSADRPLRYLRAGGTERLVVVGGADQGPRRGDTLVRRWTPPVVPFEAELYRNGGGYRLRMATVGWFDIDPVRREVALPEPADTVRLEERLWGVPALLCFRARGDHALHASAVEVGGGAVVFGGPSGSGKTTLAAAFHDAGHRLLAEDLVCARLHREVEVIPGPAMVRLRCDVAASFVPRATRVVARDAERLHLALAEDVRGTCDPVPLRAVVFLRRAERPFLERVGAEDALPDLWSLSFHLSDQDDIERCFAGVAALAARVPVFNLYRPPSIDGFREVAELVTEGLMAHV